MFDKKKGQMALKGVSGAMNVVNEMMREVKPENDISKYIDDNFGILFSQPDDNEQNMAAGLLIKLMIDEANKDPTFALDKLLKFYESFRLFYIEYSANHD